MKGNACCEHVQTGFYFRIKLCFGGNRCVRLYQILLPFLRSAIYQVCSTIVNYILTKIEYVPTGVSTAGCILHNTMVALHNLQTSVKNYT